MKSVQYLLLQMACLQECLFLISCYDNKLFTFTELRSIVVVKNPMCIMPSVHEKFQLNLPCQTVLRKKLAIDYKRCQVDNIHVAYTFSLQLSDKLTVHTLYT